MSSSENIPYQIFASHFLSVLSHWILAKDFS